MTCVHTLTVIPNCEKSVLGQVKGQAPSDVNHPHLKTSANRYTVTAYCSTEYCSSVKHCIEVFVHKLGERESFRDRTEFQPKV
ncbi:hypothetical protein X798_08146 [Onchocerca flexuosa]|uniref:ELL domain-containing protein n=2 Tax=Onchocerca flexuosa TaxID=387005 RepID=A0A183H1T6_9BILA|nr:hypothetical protein X798_08146 [Onchocerca flexuosa]VDO29567.1 unnamed protein product [Onchocerca flexuosa]